MPENPYPIERVRAIARTARIGDVVLKRTAEDLDCGDLHEARAFIVRVLQALKEEDFCETKTQKYDDGTELDADIYCVCNELGVWYVKFALINELRVMSCHFPREAMFRPDGTKVDPP